MKSTTSIAIGRSLGFWILFIVLLIAVAKLFNPLFPPAWEQFVYGTGGTLAAFALCWLFISREKKTFQDYELYWQSATIGRFLKGIIIGAAIFAVIILAMVLLGGLSLSRASNWDPASAFWLLSIFPLALMEEVAFRSFPFIKLQKAFGLPLTQAIVAIAFAGYHISMGWDITVALLGPGIWALVFGLGAAWSKGIALPTGIHVALNLSQQVVGMKDGKAGSIWILSENQSTALMPADTVGMICQVAAGVLAFILTIWYSRKK
jgi:uncharacterized protein